MGKVKAQKGKRRPASSVSDLPTLCKIEIDESVSDAAVLTRVASNTLPTLVSLESFLFSDESKSEPVGGRDDRDHENYDNVQDVDNEEVSKTLGSSITIPFCFNTFTQDAHSGYDALRGKKKKVIKKSAGKGNKATAGQPGSLASQIPKEIVTGDQINFVIGKVLTDSCKIEDTVAVKRFTPPIVKRFLQIAQCKIGSPPKETDNNEKISRLLHGFRNFCRLPKSFRWMCCEFFYSSIDKAILETSNDFADCLEDFFPTLKDRKLRRSEWSKIRSMLGKPRRFSAAFLEYERRDLENKRSKIRQIQRRQFNSSLIIKDLPDEIPMHFRVATRVTAIVRGKYYGIHSGTVEAVDLASNSYRITFDCKSIGTRSIVDYEVVPNEPPDFLSTSSVTMKLRSAADRVDNIIGNRLPNDTFHVDGQLGGFSICFLEKIVRLKNILQIKYRKIHELKELNAEAEKQIAKQSRYPQHFVLKYAQCIASCNVINENLQMLLNAVSAESSKLCDERGLDLKLIDAQQFEKSCNQKSKMLVQESNIWSNPSYKVKNGKILSLIENLGSLMFQVKGLSMNDDVWHACDLHSIKQTLRQVNASVVGKNVQCFQNRVEIPFTQIAAGILYSSKHRSNCTHPHVSFNN